MLTIFTHTKAFKGHVGLIQRNAISQWARLRPRPEIILFGNDEGTSEIARELGLRHIPDVRRNECGTPLLSDLFEKAHALASHNTLCYVNADIILLGDFMGAVQQVVVWRDRFLMVGRRTNVDLDEPAIYESPDQEELLRALVSQRGRLGAANSIDYFVFPRGLFPTLPEFAIGRFYWDNWMIWRARALRVAVVDASAAILAVHQNHDPHHPRGQGIRGEEDRQNRRLAGRGIFKIMVGDVAGGDDATHKLMADGIKARPFLSFIPKAVRACWWRFLGITRPIRRPLGLTREKVASVLGRVGETLSNSSARLVASTALKPIKKNGE